MRTIGLENLGCIILCPNKMFRWGGRGDLRKKQNLSYPPSQPPCLPSPQSLSLWKAGGRKIVLLWFFFLRGPPPPALLPPQRSPSCGLLGGRPPSPLVSRCLQATEPQSAHCPAGAGRPAGPWRRITVRPTPVRESFLMHSLW